MKIPKNISKPRQVEKIILQLEDGMTLDELNEVVEQSTWSSSDMVFDKEMGYYVNPDTWTLKARRQETKEEVQDRIDEWVERMVEINVQAEKKRTQRNDKDWKEYQRLQKKFGK